MDAAGGVRRLEGRRWDQEVRYQAEVVWLVDRARRCREAQDTGSSGGGIVGKEPWASVVIAQEMVERTKDDDTHGWL